MSSLAPLLTSKSDRWWTPPDLEQEIRTFLGGTYYDPCPPRMPGEPIESGLWSCWEGQVFCNPPYGRVIPRWITKALTEPVNELILLVPSRTGVAWFHPLYDYPICFLRGRLRFSGSQSNAPFDSALVYRGPRPLTFCMTFAHRGSIVRRMEVAK